MGVTQSDCRCLYPKQDSPSPSFSLNSPPSQGKASLATLMLLNVKHTLERTANWAWQFLLLVPQSHWLGAWWRPSSALLGCDLLQSSFSATDSRVPSGEGLRKGLPLIKAICSVCFPHSWSYLMNLFLRNNIGGLVKNLHI